MHVFIDNLLKKVGADFIPTARQHGPGYYCIQVSMHLLCAKHRVSR